MVTVKQDAMGLFAIVAGWIVRPQRPSSFRVGDRVDGHHFRGSTKVGIGKNEETGKYQEYWKTTGLAH